MQSANAYAEDRRLGAGPPAPPAPGAQCEAAGGGRSAIRRTGREAEEAECGPVPPNTDNSLSDGRRTGPRPPGEPGALSGGRGQPPDRLPKRAPPGQGGQAAESVVSHVAVRSYKKREAYASPSAIISCL